MKLEFKPEDIYGKCIDKKDDIANLIPEIIDVINQRLQEMLRDAPVVYRHFNPHEGITDNWWEKPSSRDTTKARLVEIEEL